jgi:hypothetical protein
MPQLAKNGIGMTGLGALPGVGYQQSGLHVWDGQTCLTKTPA